MEPLEADRSTRSARVLGTFVSWAIAAANAKGISKIDPNVVVDRETLRRVGKVVCVYTTMPIVQGCTALLELISRLILLLIFLALSCSPRHRTVVVERVRTSLQQRINSVRGALTGPGFGDAAFGSSADSLPTNARLLIVGAGGVGKTALSRALKRLAKKGGMGDVAIAEAHGPRLPDIEALGSELELVLIVWEAAQGTPLPAYVARYAQQLKQQDAKRRTHDEPTIEDITATHADDADESPRAPLLPSAPPPAEAAGAEQQSRRWRLSGEQADSTAAGTSADGSGGVRDEQRASLHRRAVSPPLAAAPAPAAAAPTAARGGAASRGPRVLVICNKCDVMPCPMPQIRGLPAAQAFIAVSAERGTNLAHLWSMILPILKPKHQQQAAGAAGSASQLSAEASAAD